MEEEALSAQIGESIIGRVRVAPPPLKTALLDSSILPLLINIARRQ